MMVPECDPNRWELIASLIGKSPEEVMPENEWTMQNVYQAPWTRLDDTKFEYALEMVPECDPNRWELIANLIGKSPEEVMRRYVPKVSSGKPVRKRRIAWNKTEHLKFLKGLEIFGRGDWKKISTYMQTRTPTQVASHAQKFFLRHSTPYWKKKRPSIHDIKTDAELMFQCCSVQQSPVQQQHGTSLFGFDQSHLINSQHFEQCGQSLPHAQAQEQCRPSSTQSKKQEYRFRYNEIDLFLIDDDGNNAIQQTSPVKQQSELFSKQLVNQEYEDDLFKMFEDANASMLPTVDQEYELESLEDYLSNIFEDGNSSIQQLLHQCEQSSNHLADQPVGFEV